MHGKVGFRCKNDLVILIFRQIKGCSNIKMFGPALSSPKLKKGKSGEIANYLINAQHNTVYRHH